MACTIRLAAVLAGILLAGMLAAAQQPPTFRATTQIVPLYVTVTDDDRRLVPDLVQEDFEVLDNGVVQELALFESEVQPITVAVLGWTPAPA